MVKVLANFNNQLDLALSLDPIVTFAVGPGIGRIRPTRFFATIGSQRCFAAASVVRPLSAGDQGRLLARF